MAVAAAEADPQLLLPALVSPHAKADALVEYPNGAKVPADTLSVQAARAAHLAAKVILIVSLRYKNEKSADEQTEVHVIRHLFIVKYYIIILFSTSHSPMGTQLLATTLENVKQKQKPTLMLGMGYTEDIMDLDTDIIIL